MRPRSGNNTYSPDMISQLAGRHSARISVRFVGLLPGFSDHLASLRPSPVDDGVHQVPDVFHGGPVAQCLVHIPARARQVQLVAHNLGQSGVIS